MRHVLAVLALQLVTLPPARDPARAVTGAPAARWAFVSAYVTVPSARTARRIKVVTTVFPLCDDRELPSMVFAVADSSLRAAVRSRTRAPFTITHRGLEVRTSRDSAEAARRRGLVDDRFAQTLQTELGVACCCERAPPVEASDTGAVAFVAAAKGGIGCVSAGTSLPGTVQPIGVDE